MKPSEPASAVYDRVIHANTVAQAGVPPSPEPMAISTSVSPETKRPRMCGVDAVLPGTNESPNAELAIAEVFSSLKTKIEREFSEALSKVHACGLSHIQMSSGLAGSAMKTLREMVSSLQDKCFPKNAKKNPPIVGVTATSPEGTSHQAGTSGVTIHDDAVRIAVPLLPAVVSGTRPVRQSTNRLVRPSSNALPSVAKGQTFDTYGTIVGVNHEKKFAFIRSSRHTTDFYVGRQQYHNGMAVGDEVTFVYDWRVREPTRHRRRRCPEAHRVELLARAWTRYRIPYGTL